MFLHFRSNFEAAQPPILIDNMHAILENEKIERHIMKHIPGGHNLFVAGRIVKMSQTLGRVHAFWQSTDNVLQTKNLAQFFPLFCNCRSHGWEAVREFVQPIQNDAGETRRCLQEVSCGHTQTHQWNSWRKRYNNWPWYRPLCYHLQGHKVPRKTRKSVTVSELLISLQSVSYSAVLSSNQIQKRSFEMSTMIFFSRHPFFDWWHLVLFRLWANAQTSTHSGGRSVFPRFRYPSRDDTPLEVHQGNVRTRRIRSVMSCRSGITWISTIISTFYNNGC